MPAALLMARVTGLLRAIGRGDTGPDDDPAGARRAAVPGQRHVHVRHHGLRRARRRERRASLRERGPRAAAPAAARRRDDGARRSRAGPPSASTPASGSPCGPGTSRPGDTLVLCTDGVTEAFDRAGTAFGLERFQRVVAETPADALAALPERLVEAVERFSVGGAPRDDLAIAGPPVPAPRRDGGRARGGNVAILGRQRARDRRPGVAVHRDDPAGPRRSGGDRPRLRPRRRGAPDERGHPRLPRPARAPGARRAPAPPGEDPEIRLEDAGPPFNPLEAPRAGPRGAARRPSGRRARPPAGQSPRRPLGVCARGRGQRRHAPLGTAGRSPGGRGLRGRDTVRTRRGLRARDRDRRAPGRRSAG